MSQPYIGQIILVGFNFAPVGFLPCDGQLLSIAQNDVLFQVIGTTYGGDGQTTFALPDLRGRVPIGMGQGPGLSSRIIGEQAGKENQALAVSNLPVHTHSIDMSNVAASVACKAGAGNSRSPVGNILAGEAGGVTRTYTSAAADAAMGGTLAPATIAPTGAAGTTGAHENMQPFLVMNYCIAVSGVFPSQA